LNNARYRLERLLGDGTLRTVIDLTIGPSGDVTDVHQVTRSRSLGPSKTIADAWLRAIRKWKFQPTAIDGQPVSVCTAVSVTIDI
jgi:outer membrane biosynthesis protein TonB